MNDTSSNYDILAESLPRTGLVSNSNYVALLSFVISIVGFFVPLIFAFGLLGTGASGSSAALGSLFSTNKSSKSQVEAFIKNKRKLKRRKETEFQDRSFDYTYENSDQFAQDEDINNWNWVLHRTSQ